MSPRLLVDEDVPRSCVERLRDRGAFVVDLRDERPRGLSDDEVCAFAQRLGLTLLTGHAGFGDIARFPLDRRPDILVVATDDPEIWAPALGDVLL
ncbi:MAG TPA: DUF5615 family PIN-like protein [Candidatus Polarisedimenticolaceae bacterium]|nr:DUF5615 family PIN-like protein [Candidatus Polarisedimenticolaceae bacterium]